MKSFISNIISIAILASTPFLVQAFPNGTNLYEAPNPNTSVRGACPIINTIANHGFINRSGKNVDLFEMVDILAELFGVSVASLTGVANSAVNLGLTFKDRDGIERLNLDRLHDHNLQEHDASLFREDAFFGDDRRLPVNDTLFNSFLRINPNSDVITKEELLQHQFDRIVDSRRNNPEFDLPFGIGSISFQGTFVLIVGQHPNLESVDKEALTQFFLLERFPDGYVPLPADTSTFGNDVSGSVVREFFANSQAALAAELTPL